MSKFHGQESDIHTADFDATESHTLSALPDVPETRTSLLNSEYNSIYSILQGPESPADATASPEAPLPPSTPLCNSAEAAVSDDLLLEKTPIDLQNASLYSSWQSVGSVEGYVPAAPKFVPSPLPENNAGDSPTLALYAMLPELMEVNRPSSILSSDYPSDNDMDMYAPDTDDRFTPSLSMSPMLVSTSFNRAHPLSNLVKTDRDTGSSTEGIDNSSSTVKPDESVVIVKREGYGEYLLLVGALCPVREERSTYKPKVEPSASFVMPRVDVNIPVVSLQDRLRASRPLFPNQPLHIPHDHNQHYSYTQDTAFQLVYDSNSHLHRRHSTTGVSGRNSVIRHSDDYYQTKLKHFNKLIKQLKKSLKFSKLDRLDPLNLTFLFSASLCSELPSAPGSLLKSSLYKIFGPLLDPNIKPTSRHQWLNLSLMLGVSLAGIWLIYKNFSVILFWAPPSPKVDLKDAVDQAAVEFAEKSTTGTTREELRELKRLMGKVMKDYLVGVWLEFKGNISKFVSEF
ncbi:hypothetical protein BABINDRAFT_163854 [Babjeviella inositovora NRRL Y-12698]|uniref:Uncharacterized protein n=1 Tax=Babjeviella inositovora NRRL Y-12698 TaxID=984486 RepID=A0A1E3QJG4_9ASCO|nr:uncharacterized protein BABINDRAFT_163854 [Babjeviella inositovora NRRL Y-12698]ODQ77127.1 hypothetical protein BABINDRAFT_163854 [Babjeviella inositovora NRRL Y-12698]